MGRFVAIDFETANEQRSSACAVAAITVDDGHVTHRWSTLIDPEDDFAPMNVAIHGIRPTDVSGAPNFPDAVRPLMSLIDLADVVVAHSAAFDIQVLRAAALRYELDVPPFPFACTRVFARHWFPGWPSYALTYCTTQLGIDEMLQHGAHHDPGWDAEACALIAVAGLDRHGHLGLRETAEAHDVVLGTFNRDAYRGCVTAGYGSGRIAPTATPGAEFDPEHPLYGVTVAFTGTLAHYVRREAAQLVVDRGGHFSSNVTAATGLLVVGEQDLAKLAGHSISSKMRKAAAMAADDHPIEIIDEVDFYRLL